jgi:hypothetical protein
MDLAHCYKRNTRSIKETTVIKKVKPRHYNNLKKQFGKHYLYALNKIIKFVKHPTKTRMLAKSNVPKIRHII